MINKVILIGNVGADPEIKFLDGGVPYTRINVATNERYKNKEGQWVDQTEWHTVVLWRNLATSAQQSIKKGAQVYVEGRLRTRSWDDQNGIKHTITEVVADICRVLGRRESGTTPPPPPVPPLSSNQPVEVNNSVSHSSEPVVVSEVAEETNDLPF